MLIPRSLSFQTGVMSTMMGLGIFLFFLEYLELWSMAKKAVKTF